MSRGFVYILSNPSMPGLVKIGKTIRSVEGRANELYQTGVPTPFKVEHSVEAPDCHALELTMHSRFADRRVSEGREFFAVSVQEARGVIEEELFSQVTDWLNDFLPDHMISECGMWVDPSTFMILADRSDIHPFIIASMIEYLRPEDLAHAKGKYDERIAARRLRSSQREEVIQ